MKLCGKMIKKGTMTEARPCLRKKGTCRAHTPNLKGMQFGGVRVISRAPDYITLHKGVLQHQTCWYVKDRFNHIRSISASHLMSGYFTGTMAAKGSGHGSSDGKGKIKPEYQTVAGHWHRIFNKKGYDYTSYRGMPFYDDWNPKKGGSFLKGMFWIIDNLGKRPGPTWSMDIVEHARGFIPGNLRWACKRQQRSNQQHRTLGKFSLKELRVELRRHGYGIHKI